MLPNVTLKAVSRDDVDRVGWWLEDEEVSSRWFGHYGCGDPVHRGYDPTHMLESTDWEWQRVFADPHRIIFSIYNDQDEHFGESQVLLDGEGGAELSLLIGRKDLWHHGYGTSTVLALLDRVFSDLRLERCWVNVPEDNEPALGLFEKLGFIREACRELCKRADGTPLRACILAMDAKSYQARQPVEASAPESTAVLTITGMPGSGSEAIGAEIAKQLGCRFVDEEIYDMLCQRLRCTAGEIEWIEASHRSFWSRMLNAIVVPMEWSATYDAGYHLFRPDLDFKVTQDHLTKDQYLKGLAGVVKTLCAEGRLVLHGHGSHLFAPPDAGAINVFVSASAESRQNRIASELGISIEEAGKWLKSADQETLSISTKLLGSDLRDMGQFDITLNSDRVSAETAAKMVVGAAKTVAVAGELSKSAQIAREMATT